MSRRHARVVLTMVAGLVPLGCANWQPCWMREVCTLVGPAQPAAPAPAAAASGELVPAQAAQLCLSAGEALEKKGYVAEAIAQYENARTHDPQARVARRLAVLYDLQGDAPHAEAEYGRALQEQPNDPELLNDVGYFHFRHDHVDVAESWLRKAVTANPGCACAWINLGQVLARRGRLEESYEAFARVLRPAEAYSNLGVLLAKQGRNVEARHMLQKALSLDPNLKQPQAFLGALPPGPAPLPPGLTHHKAVEPEPAVNLEEMPTVLVPTKASAPSAPTPAPVRATPVVTPAAAPMREVTHIPPPPMTLAHMPEPRPVVADARPATPAVPVPPAPAAPGASLTPVSWLLPSPAKAAPAPTPAATPKAEDNDLPIILNVRPQPRPVSTYTPPKVSVPSPPPPTSKTSIPAPPTVAAKISIPAPPVPTPKASVPAAAPPAPKASVPTPPAPKVPPAKPAPSEAPRVLHLEEVPTVPTPVKKPAPRAILIDCTAEPDESQP